MIEMLSRSLRMLQGLALSLVLACSTYASELWIGDAELQAGQEVSMPVMIDEATNAATIMVAEKAADLLLTSRSANS